MSRLTGGMVARARGQVAEEAVIAGFDTVALSGRCAYAKTYPQTKVVYTRGRKNVIFTGVGAPDFVSGIQIGEHTYPMWLEIKTSTKKGAMTSKSTHQYYSLMNMYRAGGLAGYLVLWRRNKTSRAPLIDEWRIHHISTVNLDEYRGLVKITRMRGIVISADRQLSLFGDDDIDVWTRQPHVPDIMDVANALLTHGQE